MNFPVNLPTDIHQRIPNAILPVEYAAACRAIAACLTIDESKNWSDKADALAAWAKIYKSDQASLEAKRLKLHAYRRMSELSDQLRPANQKEKGPGAARGARPGPQTLLTAHGFSQTQAQNIRKIGAIPHSQFEVIINSENPPGIKRAAFLGRGQRLHHGGRRPYSNSYFLILEGLASNMGVRALVSRLCRKYPAKDLAKDMRVDEAEAIRPWIIELIDWMDDFDQSLPKTKGTRL